MTTSAVKNNLLPPGLVSNLQQVLLSRKGGEDEQSKKNGDDSADKSSSTSPSDKNEPNSDKDDLRHIVLVTNGDGIESPGLTYLVEALIREGLYNVHVCAPQSDKSVSGHSVTLRETVAVSSAEINDATAFEVSGTPADCVSLALSGALFSWSKPLLVISGINKGSCCGHQMIYSGVVAGAREALMSGTSMKVKIAISRNAATVCLPLINAAIRDIEKGIFPKSCLLNVEVPTSALTNKGFKLTKQSLWRSTPSWQAISANKSAGRFMSNQQSLGMQLAQLGRDASAAGAARRLTTQRKNLEVVESVGVAGKSDFNRSVKYFRLEFLDKEQDDVDEDFDFRALQDGFVTITPISRSPHIESDVQTAASEWISSALQTEQ
ncbi:survival protein SurE-like phosphatase/nucleotidase [Actinidia rufa]|uniref:Survival protein SurE-like phosphatase/nucleotidase n=1 Tax=Actinidia rufa TaxID=165716 RepID=A0A7J0GLW6_9ERIC|nr:survival protein SurE-like phosphatase/nucleotidase [Actinidia rufa]